MGYRAAGSMMSLLIGCGVGALILILTALTASRPAFAYRTLGIVALGLTGFWIYRGITVYQDGKSVLLPAMNGALSIGVFAILGLAHLAAQKRSP